MRIRRKKQYQAVEPDEILIDAQNLPGFDASQLEGRIERPIEGRAFRDFLILSIVIGVVFLLQLGRLQIVEADALKARAEANRLQQTLVIAERGRIVDRHGNALALNTPNDELGFSTRSYPYGESTAHIVGYVSYPKRDQNDYWFQESTKGLAGIELVLDERLRGENGIEIKETSAIGETVSGSIVHIPQKGEEIHLSLDADLQKTLYEAIKERATNGSFVGGSGVVMDAHTGEIHALVSYPSFNAELVSSGDDSDTISTYLADDSAPFLNRAVSGLYTPGSVVKPFVALAALEEDVITPEKSILSTGSLTVPNPYDPEKPTVFRDWKAHGWTDMREAIAVSSDVYFYEIGGGFEDQEGLGIGVIDSYMRKFGFGAPTNIALSGEEVGVVPNPDWKARMFNGERWFLGNTYHTAIGQYGFQTTPLQLARATAALVNGGYLVTPTLEKNKSGSRLRIDLNEEHVRVVREGMRLAVTEGTAQALNVPGVEVAGKTGTAEVGVQKEFINSLIVGFLPYENPRFVFVVVMERADAGTLSGAPLVMNNVLNWMKEERAEFFGE